METNSLVQYLNEIASRSINGQIQWIQPNPSTFQWNSVETGLVVTIQQAGNKSFASFINSDERLSNSYLFQVLDKNRKQIIMSISSKERPEFFDVLNMIYLNAKVCVDNQSSDVLARLLRF